MASVRPEMMLTGTMINFAVDLLQKPEGYELMNVDESNKFLIEPEEFREMFETVSHFYYKHVLFNASKKIISL